jgi:uracil-DNA glycosylase
MKPIILLGEAFGKNEAALGVGFVGSSGVELLKMLIEAKLMPRLREDSEDISAFYRTLSPEYINDIWRRHPEFHRTNVFNLHPPADKIESLCGPKSMGIRGYPSLTKSKFVLQSYIPELERLADEILSCDPNIIICLGNTALWALTGGTGISTIRGTTHLSTHTAVGYKLLPTYHPAAVMRQWELRPTVVADLIKAGRESTFPEVRRPARVIIIEPTLDDLQAFISSRVSGCRLLSVDIETAGSQVTCIGFSPSSDLAMVVPFFDGRKKDRSYWPSLRAEADAWLLVRGVLQDPSIPKLFQNGLYDIAFLYRSMKIRVFGAEHDTMLLHHALQPESLKALGYLGSIYTDEGPWKTERKGTRTIGRDK